ncbi:MAG TPA: efflux RND transporter periplasmic adaptor subunit [Steroidobacteraceae bacterium]|nr:efflux RND transporter periplasmic adaptor subunit [Steroidobacteraceae bacterium]
MGRAVVSLVHRWFWSHRLPLAGAAATLAALTAVAGLHHSAHASAEPERAVTGAARAVDADSVELGASQLTEISVAPAEVRAFPIEKSAVGSIDFDEDLATQVFPPYPGRIVGLYARIGDRVTRGRTLFTIESPDLIQAESTLIAAAGVLDLTDRALARARELYRVQGIAQKDLQQAASDQQTAEASLEAARNAVAVFGKSAEEIDRMVRTRKVDPLLIVRSPLRGRVTARSASPGDFVAPGAQPAPFAVADVSHVWMVANVAEADMPAIRVGEPIEAHLLAYPGRMFRGVISTVGATVDPQTHRGTVRATLEDPRRELLPGMFVSLSIETGAPVTAVALPLDGVVREGDGTMTVWTTTDRRRFTKRVVRVGLEQDGYDQILEGLAAGELVVTRGAVFLDNILTGGLS